MSLLKQPWKVRLNMASANESKEALDSDDSIHCKGEEVASSLVVGKRGIEA